MKGTITLAPGKKRSQTAQARAGGVDRLPTDQGGHYIARRFNGPTEAFNHFAQDGNFNRSAYAKLEHRWAVATKRGEKVHVTVVPLYGFMSRRPREILVKSSIGGLINETQFPNSKDARYGR